MIIATTYFIKEYTKSLLTIFFLATALIFILDLAEVIKNHTIDIMLITFYKTSKNIIYLMPLVILIGTIIAFVNLLKKNELVIFTTIALSELFFIRIMGGIISLIFIITVIVLIPINSRLSLSIDKINKKISVEETGIMFKGLDNSFIRTERFDKSNLYQITVWQLDDRSNLKSVIKADNGVIKEGYLIISKPIMYTKLSEIHNDDLSIKIDITQEEIISNVLEPDQVNLFDMLQFIKIIKKLGFSITKYERYFWDRITLWLNYFTMALIGFIVSHQMIKRLMKKKQIFYGMVAGLVVFFTQNIIITMLPYSIGISVIVTKTILFTIVLLCFLRTRNYI